MNNKYITKTIDYKASTHLENDEIKSIVDKLKNFNALSGLVTYRDDDLKRLAKSFYKLINENELDIKLIDSFFDKWINTIDSNQLKAPNYFDFKRFVQQCIQSDAFINKMLTGHEKTGYSCGFCLDTRSLNMICLEHNSKYITACPCTSGNYFSTRKEAYDYFLKINSYWFDCGMPRPSSIDKTIVKKDIDIAGKINYYFKRV